MDSTLRWWLKPGEVFWHSPTQPDLSATFEWDDGALWCLKLSPAGGSVELHWDHNVPALVEGWSEIRIDPGDREDLQSVLRRRLFPHPSTLDETQRAVLDLAVKPTGGDRGDLWVLGRVLRQTLGPRDRDGIQRVIETLVPRCLAQRSTDRRDRYLPTIVGLLNSRRGTSTRDILTKLLAFFRYHLDNSPSVEQVTWQDVRTHGGLTDAQAAEVHSVIRIVGWFNGGTSDGDNFTFSLPIEVEQISEYSTVQDYFRAAGGGRLDFPWPTAPALFPAELAQMARTGVAPSPLAVADERQLPLDAPQEPPAPVVEEPVRPSLLPNRRVKALDEHEIRSMEANFRALGYEGKLEFDRANGSRTRFHFMPDPETGIDAPCITVGADIFPGTDVANPNSILDPLPAAAHEITHYHRWESGRELPIGKLSAIDEAMTSLQAVCTFRGVLRDFHNEQLVSDAMQRLNLYMKKLEHADPDGKE